VNIAIVGIGNLGAAIANCLLLQYRRPAVCSLYEPQRASLARAKAELYELVMVARKTNNRIQFNDTMPQRCDKYIITTGVPRTSPSQKKDGFSLAKTWA